MRSLIVFGSGIVVSILLFIKWVYEIFADRPLPRHIADLPLFSKERADYVDKRGNCWCCASVFTLMGTFIYGLAALILYLL